MATGSTTRTVSGTAGGDAMRRTLATAFTSGALPGEDDGFDEAASLEAADFMIATAGVRSPGDPVIAIESWTGSNGRRLMRVGIVNDDMPFLVDSIAAALAGAGVAIARVLHPVVAVARDEGGALVAIHGARADGDRHESLIYLETERIDARRRRELEGMLAAVLADVRAAVADWLKMQVALGADADSLPDGEGAALMRWFLDRNLTLLGHERLAVDGTRTDRLGIARSDDAVLLDAGSIAPAIEWFQAGNMAPLTVKAERVSNVHRRVLLDLIIVPVREGGRITGLSVTAGLWTSAALATAPGRVPILRTHLSRLLDRFAFDPAGHAGKALAHALTELPHDLVVSFTLAELERIALTAMSLSDRPRPKLAAVRAPLGRHMFVFVWLPRDDLSTRLRVAIQDMLADALDAAVIAWSLELEEGGVALLRITLDLADPGRPIDEAALDAQVERMVRGWEPAVEAELAALTDAGRAAALAVRFANALPAGYRAAYGADEAARDIMRLHALGPDRTRDVRLFRLPRDAEGRFRLKVYQSGGAMPLSDAVPVLEHFGFVVLEEMPTALALSQTGGEGGVHIHDFLLEMRGGSSAEPLLARADAVEAAIGAVLSGAAENDPFNQLITGASLDPGSVVWLRAWFRYLRQTGLSYSLQTVVDALGRAPDIARALIALFVARTDPALRGDRAAAEGAAIAAIDAGLVAVKAIDEDRILRALRGVVMAVLRTNAFAPAAAEALAFKLDSSLVPGLPAPVPWREIFVYSPRVEGIHLRAGPVARGGIRWSDRRDDFRTEILGLMKAQRVKNAVIVPTGAKGGFFAKRLPNPAQDRDAWQAEGTESYRIFIRTLLSVTDNIVEGKVVHPDRVLVRDGEDPYFVVAADKGTASFSDIANAIALDRNFWLGDAFASGGSHGYDHKAMGITARGAWISVQRHFAELGTDVQAEPVRVAGVGDMSGDVFGNGMLLSQSILLVAAFDHRHIFLDPAPDAARSWAERQRMFALPRSSWADYDPALISKGGGVFARTEKSIALSPEVRAMLGLSVDSIDPAGLMHAILTMQADLIWFGGIGTYVKAAAQGHADVGDPANDAIRVDAGQIRARVIGEGANLGVTQAGRIEFAAAGGRINTDFIDNSAGVDCSDNEVNIKIALNSEMAAGSLPFEARNALLAGMTDEVAGLVLADNRFQTLALSIAERAGAAGLASYIRLIEIFEASGRLDRKVEGLAANDVLLRRVQDGQGLTRPELAVLLSTAKLAIQDALERTPLGDEPVMDAELLAAFPTAMQRDHRAAILSHRLRREIVATKLANRMVNRMGVIHPFELAEEEGAAVAEVGTAFAIVERLYDLPALWAAVDAASLSEEVRIGLFDRVAVATRAQMADLLRTGLTGVGVGEAVEKLQPGIATLQRKVADILTDEARQQFAAQAAALTADGVAGDLAARVLAVQEMDGAIGIVDLALRRGIAPDGLATAFTGLGGALGLGWAQGVAARMAPSDPWERLLVAGLARDLQQVRLDLLARAGGEDLGTFVARWSELHADRIVQFRKLIDRARAATAVTVPMLAQIAGQARVLLAR